MRNSPAQARRFAHRLQAETHIPIYILGDNDTWNYFAFSVLRTGSVVPGRTIPFLAIKDVRYLGITIDDVRRHFSARRFRRRWKPGWQERIACLREYECFKTPHWQSEFNQFTEQRFAVDLSLALSQFEGKEAWEQLLLHKISIGPMAFLEEEEGELPLTKKLEEDMKRGHHSFFGLSKSVMSPFQYLKQEYTDIKVTESYTYDFYLVSVQTWHCCAASWYDWLSQATTFHNCTRALKRGRFPSNVRTRLGRNGFLGTSKSIQRRSSRKLSIRSEG